MALVANWRLNGNSTDLVGAKNGTDTNITYSVANGKIGQGAGFNGSSSKIVLPALGNATTISLRYWINTTQGTTGRIIEYGNYGSGDNADFEHSIASNKLQAASWNGTAQTLVNSNASVNTGKWVHCGVTRNGATVKLYVNGVFDNSSASMQTITYVSASGGTQFGAHPSGATWYSGALSEVKLDNTELAAADMKNDYAFAQGFFN